MLNPHPNMAQNLELFHLLPSAQKIALLPSHERLHYIKKDIWIGYTRAQYAISKLDNLFNHPGRQRMPNLLIVGPTNNGKSMIIQKFKRMKGTGKDILADKEHLPIIHMQMPSDPKVSRFYSMLLATIGTPFSQRLRISELETLILKILRQIDLRMLVIDEVHNLLAGSNAQQREFLNLLRFLGNELQLPIICVGTRDAYLAIRSDDQLENRFEPLTLPLWKNDEEFLKLLASFAAVLPLRRLSLLHESQIAQYILTKSEGTIGEIATLLTRAARVAIENNEEHIHYNTLKLADYMSPTERKCAFERMLA